MKAIKRTEPKERPVKREFMEVGEAILRINILFLLVNLVLKERKINQFMLYL
ncbi:hypothetical protein HF330_04235 [Bacillus pumilus]|jgi:hypothetical protein|nr:hypothetical protein [Bacillus pumilus]